MGSWLVTWEWSGDEKKPDDEIAAILNYRLSGHSVAKIVEMLYANSRYSLHERLRYAAGRFKPYSVVFDQIDGATWEGSMTCGHNPYLYARMVDELRVVEDDDGKERLVWNERARPKGRR